MTVKEAFEQKTCCVCKKDVRSTRENGNTYWKSSIFGASFKARSGKVIHMEHVCICDDCYFNN